VRDSDLPDFWRRICRLASLPEDASIDRVHAAYPVVGRGTIQRLRDGNSPRMSSLLKIAEHLRMSPADLLAEAPGLRAPPKPPRDFADRNTPSESEWQVLQDLRSIGTEDREQIIAEIHSRAEKIRRQVLEYLERLKKEGKPT
jgi:hypothetical protein